MVDFHILYATAYFKKTHLILSYIFLIQFPSFIIFHQCYTFYLAMETNWASHTVDSMNSISLGKDASKYYEL